MKRRRPSVYEPSEMSSSAPFSTSSAATSTIVKPEVVVTETVDDVMSGFAESDKFEVDDEDEPCKKKSRSDDVVTFNDVFIDDVKIDADPLPEKEEEKTGESESA